jgi:hypothetical protein
MTGDPVCAIHGMNPCRCHEFRISPAAYYPWGLNMHETQRNAQAFNDAATLAAERAHGEIERGVRDQRITKLESALGRARGCIKGLLARTPVRDVEETLAEIDAVLPSLREGGGQ